jgi:hypothetical protein
LLFLGEVKKKFDDPRPVAMQMRLEVPDRTKALAPNGLFVECFIGKSLRLKEFGMNRTIKTSS